MLVPQVDLTCAHVDPAAPLGIQGVANVPEVDVTGAHVDPAGPLGVRGVANVPQVGRICRMGRILVRYVHLGDATVRVAALTTGWVASLSVTSTRRTRGP